MTVERSRNKSGSLPRRLRVLHVIPGEPGTSEMIFARRESSELARAGIETETFYLRSRTSLRGLWRDVVEYRHRIQMFQPDLVHAQFGTMTAFFAVFATSTPAIVTLRGTDLNEDPALSRLRSFAGRMLSRLAATKAAAIVCVTNQLKGRLWWGRRRARVLPGSVDLDRFHLVDRNTARNTLGWSLDEKVVLFNQGRLPKVKRPELAAAVVQRARRDAGLVRMQILDGTIAPEMVPTFLNASDCLLITSQCEGSPTILREALACNLPVVSVDVGDVRERVEGVSETFVCNSDDVESLGRELAIILLRGLRSNGRQAVQNLSVPQFTGELLQTYRDALQSKGRHEQASLVEALRTTAVQAQS